MSPDRSLVSIVTPSLNQAQFLEATILSVLAQDYPNIEYILIDGGSSDGSLDIIRNYAEKFAYWVSEPDAGQSDAINKGWRRAKGEILAYLNSDDFYTPGAVSAAVEFLDRHTDVGIVYGSCHSIVGSGQPSYVFSPPEFSVSRLLLENFIPQPTVFLRREVIERVGVMDVTLHYCMDYDLWMRAALAGVGIQRLSGPPLASFRILSTSKTSTSSTAGLREGFVVLERAFSNGKLPTGLLKIKSYAQARRHLAIAYGHCLSGEVGEARRFLRRSIKVSKRIVWDSRFLHLLVTTLLGTQGSWLLRRAKWGAKQFLGSPDDRFIAMGSGWPESGLRGNRLRDR